MDQGTEGSFREKASSEDLQRAHFETLAVY